ncbi:PLP-dependent aminotransferase family protein [Isoptericola sp. NPDC019482]|uniref:MocR-like pyridoxine biosynthesis transcription factor PdxR n=1 Tax=Isoptericola sp. NPDC019482 TaxID=3154688 RepID=UPI00346E0818
MTDDGPRASGRGWIDRRSGEPLYLQVRAYVERGLAGGAFPARRALPSSRHLAAELGVSRNTINAAYAELVSLGLLEARPRSGLYPTATATAAVPPTAPGPAPRPAAPASSAEPDWSDHVVPVRDPFPRDRVVEPDYRDFQYPFLPGQVEERAFPSRAWLRAVTTALDGPHRRYTLRDSADRDDPLLVEAIRTMLLPAKGIDAAPDEILVTSGSQQALSVLASALLDPGRSVGVENPGYVDAARIFHRSGARVVPFPTDRDGVVLPPDPDVDLLYVTPSHHHPTNVTLSASRRDALLRAAAAQDMLVVEDDFDSEVRYVGSPTPTIKSGDAHGRVVYLGTFSKFLAPGLRVGFVVADPALIRALRDRRYYQTKHPGGHVQRALAVFLTSGDYHRQLRRHRVDLRAKWQTLGDALADEVPWALPERPTGGLSYWLTGPPGFDGTRAAALARERGVLVSPGELYHLTPDPPRRHLRVGFNAIPHARIVPGVHRLAQAMRAAVEPAVTSGADR